MTSPGSTGAENTSAQRPRPRSVEERLADLEQRLGAREESVASSFRELTTQFSDLYRRTTELEQRTATLRADLDEARRRVAMLLTPGAGGTGAAPAAATAPAAPEAPAAAPPPELRPERIGEIVILLRDPNFHGTDAIARELRPNAGRAAELLFEEIRRAAMEYRMAQRIEEIVAAFPPEQVRGTLERALRDPALRLSAARVLEQTGDAELLPVAKDELAQARSPDDELALALAVVACGDDAGVPVLLRALRSTRIDLRILAHAALRRTFRTDGFGYNPMRGPAENEDALRRWNEWWDARRQGR